MWHLREMEAGDPAMLAALTALARAGGSEALFGTLMRGDRARYQLPNPARNPRLRLRKMASKSSSPEIRLAELSARRRRAEQRDGDLLPFPTRPGVHNDAIDVETTALCEACGGRVPLGYQECACGAWMDAVGGSRSATRRRRSRDPRIALSQLRRERAGWWVP